MVPTSDLATNDPVASLREIMLYFSCSKPSSQVAIDPPQFDPSIDGPFFEEFRRILKAHGNHIFKGLVGEVSEHRDNLPAEKKNQ